MRYLVAFVVGLAQGIVLATVDISLVNDPIQWSIIMVVCWCMWLVGHYRVFGE